MSSRHGASGVIEDESEVLPLGQVQVVEDSLQEGSAAGAFL